MITIRYTPVKDLELSGPPTALEFVKSTVRRIVETGTGSARFLARPVSNPSPYATTLQMLRVRVDEGKLQVSVLGGHLIVTGSSRALLAFCGALDTAASGPPGTHSHLEYHDGHPLIAPESVPLVVTHEARRDDAS